MLPSMVWHICTPDTLQVYVSAEYSLQGLLCATQCRHTGIADGSINSLFYLRYQAKC